MTNMEMAMDPLFLGLAIFYGILGLAGLWAHFSLSDADRRVYASHKRIMKEARRARRLGYL